MKLPSILTIAAIVGLFTAMPSPIEGQKIKDDCVYKKACARICQKKYDVCKYHQCNPKYTTPKDRLRLCIPYVSLTSGVMLECSR